MQGLADGYFVAPYTISNYLARQKPNEGDVGKDHPEVKAARKVVKSRIKKLLGVEGTRTVDSFHKELGSLCWEYCGMARNKKGLETALEKIPALREEFWENVRVPGTGESFNQELEKAGRVADFLELGELMVRDALGREESCGGHFREEHATEEGEAKRDDENFAYAAAWEWTGAGETPNLHKEALKFDYVKLTQRSYK
jgi:succinate dehydrogenase / fumarate reductase flavoprotein subunit